MAITAALHRALQMGMMLEGLLSGKLFNTGVLNSKGYEEFVTANLNPGMGGYNYNKDIRLAKQINLCCSCNS